MSPRAWRAALILDAICWAAIAAAVWLGVALT